MAFNPRDPAPLPPPIVYAPPDPAIFGDWERFDTTPPPPPCRTIPVTDEMRRNDLLEQRRREAAVASAWRKRLKGEA